MKKLFFLLSLFAAYSAAQNAGRVGIGIKTLKEGHGEPVKKTSSCKCTTPDGSQTARSSITRVKETSRLSLCLEPGW